MSEEEDRPPAKPGLVSIAIVVTCPEADWPKARDVMITRCIGGALREHGLDLGEFLLTWRKAD